MGYLMKTTSSQISTGQSLADAISDYEDYLFSNTSGAVPACLIMIAWPPGATKNPYLEIVLMSSIGDMCRTEDDLELLQLKIEVPVGIGRYLLKPLHIQFEPVSLEQSRQFFDAIRATRMFWLYGRTKSVSCKFEKNGVEVLQPIFEVLSKRLQGMEMSCEEMQDRT